MAKQKYYYLITIGNEPYFKLKSESPIDIQGLSIERPGLRTIGIEQIVKKKDIRKIFWEKKK